MNDTTLTQLKIVVERAVRPVRAGTHYKRKWREELLAHVAAVFEEEAKTGDERIALAQTQKRFGEPSALTARLQESVRWGESFTWFIGDQLWPREGERTLRYALRQAVLCGIWSGLIGVMLFCLSVFGQYPNWLMGTLALAAPVEGFVLAFLVCFLMRRTWLAVYGLVGTSWRDHMIVVGGAGLIGPSGLLFWILARWCERGADPFEAFVEAIPYLPGAISAAPFCLIFAVHLLRQGLHGLTGIACLRGYLVTSAYGVAVLGIVFALGAILSGDAWTGLEGLIPILFVLKWVIPIDLLARGVGAYAAMRHHSEWASLPIDDENGATA